ncbi:S41 family peptidase [Indioceanicola profundi]|uniref:S41 family peptidase n=1 Tax=Indioceanicola profundi TaxID=2220096 RepID=UPI000E6ACD31|nr:S41 family peptidase [Indioceanicola profundi]
MRQRPLALAAVALLLTTGVPNAVPAARPVSAAPQTEAARAEEEAAVKLFLETFRAVRTSYVDPVPAQELAEAAARAMVQQDRWSTYLSTGQYEETRLKRDGAMVGLGLTYTRSDAGLAVTSIVEGSPAAGAGLQAGDLITAVDGVPAGGMDQETATKALKGPRGSTVRLLVERGGTDARQAVSMTLARDLLTLQSVEYKAMDDVGYVRIARFDRQTYPGVTRAVETLRKEKGAMLRGLILDLRGNPGGLVKAAVDTADAFLEGGVILRQELRAGAEGPTEHAHKGDVAGGLPLVLLVDSKSASAAEILAGALQDNRRAVLVGQRTYGKGVIQSFLPVHDGGAIKLTTARYRTPEGHPVDQVGISPDHQVAMPDPAGGASAQAEAGADPQLALALSLLRTGA